MRDGMRGIAYRRSTEGGGYGRSKGRPEARDERAFGDVIAGDGGPYPLSDEAIDEALKRTSAGNYALGYMDGDAFNVFYVGRSDTDLRQRLHEWVGMPSRTALDGPPASAVYEPRPARRL
jgi:hypothetical protein